MDDAYLRCFQEMHEFGKPYEAEAAKIIEKYNRYIPADKKEDLQQATDIKALYGAVGVRGRKHEKYFNEKFKYEFTIRADLPSGQETEIHKINVRGFTDAMFYCYGIDKKIKEWVYIDLHWFRKVLLHFREEGRLNELYTYHESANGVNFFAFDIRKFQEPKLVIASSFSIC